MKRQNDEYQKAKVRNIHLRGNAMSKMIKVLVFTTYYDFCCFRSLFTSLSSNIFFAQFHTSHSYRIQFQRKKICNDLKHRAHSNRCGQLFIMCSARCSLGFAHTFSNYTYTIFSLRIFYVVRHNIEVPLVTHFKHVYNRSVYVYMVALERSWNAHTLNCTMLLVAT